MLKTNKQRNIFFCDYLLKTKQFWECDIYTLSKRKTLNT